MAWKGNCKQLDLLVWRMTGNEDTIFLEILSRNTFLENFLESPDKSFWINLAQEQKVIARLGQMQKPV